MKVLLIFLSVISISLQHKASTVESLTNRIVHGKPASRGQFPWHATIKMKMQGYDSICGGAIISDSWVLTAAHCVVGGTDFKLTFGNIYIWENLDTRRVKEVILHPYYNSSFLNNDIALIHLDAPLEFSDKIKPVRLPKEGQRVKSGQMLRISGFGFESDKKPTPSSNLNYVDLMSIMNFECALSFISGLIQDSTLCCIGRPDGAICQGDSGGALVQLEEDGLYTHAGIVSFVSDTGCESGLPGGFTRTESFLPWIEQIVSV